MTGGPLCPYGSNGELFNLLRSNRGLPISLWEAVLLPAGWSLLNQKSPIPTWDWQPYHGHFSEKYLAMPAAGCSQIIGLAHSGCPPNFIQGGCCHRILIRHPTFNPLYCMVTAWLITQITAVWQSWSRLGCSLFFIICHLHTIITVY